MLVVLAVVVTYSLLDAAVVTRLDTETATQHSVDTLHLLATDASVSNGTFIRFLADVDANVGSLLHLAVCSTGSMLGCVR